MTCRWQKLRPSLKRCDMNGINGYQHGGRTFPRKMGRNDRLACQYGQTSWCRKYYASCLRHTLNHNSQTIHTDFDQNEDVTLRCEKSTVRGEEQHGSSKETSHNASTNSAMNCSLKLSRSTFMTVGLSGFCKNSSMQDIWKTGHSTKRQAEFR